MDELDLMAAIVRAIESVKEKHSELKNRITLSGMHNWTDSITFEISILKDEKKK